MRGGLRHDDIVADSRNRGRRGQLPMMRQSLPTVVTERPNRTVPR